MPTEELQEEKEERVTSERVRRRVQLDFSEEAYTELEGLVRRGRHTSMKAMIVEAIKKYDWLLTRSEQGFAFQITKGDDVRTMDLHF